MKAFYAFAIENIADDDYESRYRVVNWTQKRIPSLPKDVIEHSLVRHYSQECVFLEFQHIDLDNSNCYKKSFSTQEIMSFEYARFVTLKSEFDFLKNRMNHYYFNNNFDKGTFKYPILVTEINHKYYIIDGNNRYRHFRSLVKYHPSKVNENHYVYILENKY